MSDPVSKKFFVDAAVSAIDRQDVVDHFRAFYKDDPEKMSALEKILDQLDDGRGSDQEKEWGIIPEERGNGRISLDEFFWDYDRNLTGKDCQHPVVVETFGLDEWVPPVSPFEDWNGYVKCMDQWQKLFLWVEVGNYIQDKFGLNPEDRIQIEEVCRHPAPEEGLVRAPSRPLPQGDAVAEVEPAEGTEEVVTAGVPAGGGKSMLLNEMVASLSETNGHAKADWINSEGIEEEDFDEKYFDDEYPDEEVHDTGDYGDEDTGDWEDTGY